jgi:hypothetical protein
MAGDTGGAFHDRFVTFMPQWRLVEGNRGFWPLTGLESAVAVVGLARLGDCRMPYRSSEMRRNAPSGRNLLGLLRTNVAIGLSGLLLLCPIVAVAAEKVVPDRTPMLKSLIACRGMTEAAERLACYDKAAAEIDKAEAGGDIVVVDRQQARAARRRAFGFNFAELSIFDRATTKSENEVLESTVRAAHRNPDGRWVITLEDGAVWREVGDPEPNLEPVPGAPVRISHASLGSFMIKIHGLSTHVHRDQ